MLLALKRGDTNKYLVFGIQLLTLKETESHIHLV